MYYNSFDIEQLNDLGRKLLKVKNYLDSLNTYRVYIDRVKQYISTNNQITVDEVIEQYSKDYDDIDKVVETSGGWFTYKVKEIIKYYFKDIDGFYQTLGSVADTHNRLYHSYLNELHEFKDCIDGKIETLHKLYGDDIYQVK